MTLLISEEARDVPISRPVWMLTAQQVDTQTFEEGFACYTYFIFELLRGVPLACNTAVEAAHRC